MLGWLRPFEARQRLPAGQCHHRRHRLDTEHRGHPRRGVDVHRGQRPRATIGNAQRRQGVSKLNADVAARRPQQNDDRDLPGAYEDLGFKIGLGHLYGAGDPTGGATCRTLRALLENGEVNGTGHHRRRSRKRTSHSQESVMSVPRGSGRVEVESRPHGASETEQ